MSAYDKVKAGLKQAIAYERGELPARTVRLTVEPLEHFEPAEIKQIRANTGMTQRMFADVMGVSLKTIEAWEAGRNKPVGLASRMLSMMKADLNMPAKMNFVSH